jgi:coenzyme F420-0:L-glutamate ligase/coenzyme F420-1:gamma-L-glutamate ligase
MTNLSISAYAGIPEIQAGDDLALILGDAIAESEEGIQDGDILVVTSKIVSKAEGRQVPANDREEAISSETVRVVASREHPGGTTRIVENKQGLVLAAAGVDNSNTPDGVVLLLPKDPDASAAKLNAELRARFSVSLGIIISDTLGRPWREGQTDVAIGASGVRTLMDYRGTYDSHGNVLSASEAAVADEIAGAADLIKQKSTGRPVALVRGLNHLVLSEDEILDPAHTARALIRPSDKDMFRLGSKEAYAQGFKDGKSAAATAQRQARTSR